MEGWGIVVSDGVERGWARRGDIRLARRRLGRGG